LTGDCPTAASHLSSALELYRDLSARPGEAEALNALGELSLASGAPAETQSHYDQALAIAIAIASPLQEARAREGIGRCRLHYGQIGEAAAPLREALAIYQRIGSPYANRVQAALRDNCL